MSVEGPQMTMDTGLRCLSNGHDIGPHDFSKNGDGGDSLTRSGLQATDEGFAENSDQGTTEQQEVSQIHLSLY